MCQERAAEKLKGHLYETISTSSDKHLAIRGEHCTLRVAFLAKLDCTVKLAGVTLPFISGALCCAAE